LAGGRTCSVSDILANLFEIRKKCFSSGRHYTSFYRKLLNLLIFQEYYCP